MKEGDRNLTTLNDVAKKANVSKMTVSRVINYPEQVTAELQELVYQAMKDLNYKPNRLAKALANNQTQMIKLYILEEMRDVEPYYMNLLTGIANELDNQGYGLQLLTQNNTNIGNADGYIICGMREPDYEMISQIKEPVVLFGDNDHGFDFIDSNNEQSIEKAMDYGLSVNYSSIVFVQIDVDEPFAHRREKGYLNGIAKHQLDPTIIRLNNDSDEAAEYISDHLTEYPRNTLFICASDRLALGVSRGIMQKSQKLPDDYGVIGHDGVFLDRVASPKLTTIKQPFTKMGEACARMLVQKIKQNGRNQGSNLHESELIIGGTTR